MKYYKQLIQIHDPNNNKIGDCFRTAIGCILDIPPANVPHFVENNYGDTISLIDVVNDVNKWLLEVRPDLQYVEIYDPGEFNISSIGFHVLTGPSPRNSKIHHSIVGLNGKPFHDPSNDNAMIIEKDLQFGLFINRML